MVNLEVIKKTREYIKNSWSKAVRAKDNNANFILPYDFIPPCVDYFTTLYYWDTYFTNKGLYLDGLAEYAYNNIQNLLFCLRKFGCVPNCCYENGAKHASQPPLLFLMVEDYYRFSKDKIFLKQSYSALEIEYNFWNTRRIRACQLNGYGTNRNYEQMDKSELLREIAYYAKRVNKDFSKCTEEELREKLKNVTAEGESGEDHTPRFADKAFEICSIDLNSILYGFEKTMAFFAKELDENEEEWENRAQRRKTLIYQYCFDEGSGVFFDYNAVTQKRTGVYCAACYLPFVFGLSKDLNALNLVNEKLIFKNGTISCQVIENTGGVFQWGYPNAWAPHQYYAYTANMRLNNSKTAKDIALKWLNTVSQEFEKSGKLYEKYDAVVGGKATVNEYGTPEMLGWTAGVFNYFVDAIKL